MSPARTGSVRHIGTGSPFSVAAMSAPVTAARPSRAKRRAGAEKLTFESGRIGRIADEQIGETNDQESTGPDGGKPCSQKPMRPGSS
jgi:hypothetical protein